MIHRGILAAITELPLNLSRARRDPILSLHAANEIQNGFLFFSEHGEERRRVQLNTCSNEHQPECLASIASYELHKPPLLFNLLPDLACGGSTPLWTDQLDG